MGATDGTERSGKAVRAAVQLAHDEHASITGFFPLNLAAARPHINTPWMLSMHDDLERRQAIQMRREAEEALAFIAQAEKDGCDLIFMASDQRGGIAE